MSLSRRAMFGGLALAIAAPAVIRTPGLLMPIKSLPRAITLADWAARMPEPHNGLIVRLLNESNEIMEQLNWSEGFRPVVYQRTMHILHYRAGQGGGI